VLLIFAWILKRFEKCSLDKEFVTFGGIRELRRMIGQGFLEAQIRVFNRGAKKRNRIAQ